MIPPASNVDISNGNKISVSDCVGGKPMNLIMIHSKPDVNADHICLSVPVHETVQNLN